MIKRLHIRDFAIIEAIELEFSTGMTVLTGETGAGKSILIDALGLILGDRAETNVIRDGSDRAEITAVFEIDGNQAVIELLEEQSIITEDEELYIRRIIARDGRSRAFINNSPATAQLLRDIGENLIDIHGQHSHQSLTKPETQRQLLDDYGDYPGQLEAVRKLYGQWQEATNKLQHLLEGNTDQDATMTLLRYQIEELRGINPEPGEYESLDEEQRRLANSSRLLETAGNALQIFREDDNSVYSQLSSITNELKSLQQYDEAIANIVRILNDASIQIDEATDELRRYIDNLPTDPERLSIVENRLSLMHEVARKHRIKPHELASYLAGLEQKLESMENSQKFIDELLVTQSNVLNEYRETANKLHNLRVKTAKKMATEITAKLGELGMANGQFSIELEKLNDDIPRPNGNDRIELLVTTNPGMAAQPLRKIASGGELSRISLAIQVTGNRDKGIPTLIFDEVDAGIGGGVAEIVGRLLHNLANKRQVFCVTHLPQVASQGDHHLLVNKTSTKSSTITGVKELAAEERIEEIARMLGGMKITEQSRKHAKEMLSHV